MAEIIVIAKDPSIRKALRQVLEGGLHQVKAFGDGQPAIEHHQFNPVDLVCGLKNYKEERFDLRNYIDPDMGFISHKSKDGRDLKALELPGLWNGAMADWNTLFVEVPLSTFNPVKTIFDLLRPEHQAEK